MKGMEKAKILLKLFETCFDTIRISDLWNMKFTFVSALEKREDCKIFSARKHTPLSLYFRLLDNNMWEIFWV